jgi:uncharacterized protein (TIGR00299 family) protein
MAQVMYLDCFSGAAGDMLLGALLDAGLPADGLRGALGSLGVDYELRIRPVVRAGITATHFEVVDPHAGDDPPFSHVHAHASHDDRHRHHAHEASDRHHDHGREDADPPPHPPSPTHQHGGAAHSHPPSSAHGHRTLAEIGHLIGHSALSAAGKDRAVELFRRIGEAEAAIHGTPIDQVHLHEVGALDSIIDIVGVVFAMEWFGIDDVVASPLNVGGGTVDIAHGRYPVPAPATARLLTGVPIYGGGPDVELVTPTGALLVSAYARAYGALPPMAIGRVGYGAGRRDFPRQANVLRVVIGERRLSDRAGAAPAAALEAIVKIECEIDDMNPQWFGPASDRLFEAGALDVFLGAVQMKKGRPGTLVTVLAPEDRRAALCDVLFRETTTLGVRFERMWRETLERRWETVTTEGGPVRIKVSSRDGRMFNAVPEFEDCLAIATRTGQPVKDVQGDALRAWYARGSGSTSGVG